MISFTGLVKEEVSKIDTIGPNGISELSAIIRNAATIDKKIKITTENASVARHIFNLIKKLYEVNPKIIVRQSSNYRNRHLYILEIENKKELILNDLSIYDNKKNLKIPKNYIVDDEELARSYLRGLFITTGSVNDPKKSRYHLEFLVDDYNYAKWISDLLNKDYLNSKVIKRDNKYMVYIKEAEKIGDFLRIIGAFNAIMYYEDIRIYRDHKNMTNRLNNCEQANVEKSMLTSNKQIQDINIKKKKIGLDALDFKLEEVSLYRLKYPEASLQELSEIMTIETNKQITKSGLNHRFRKIKEIAKRIRES